MLGAFISWDPWLQRPNDAKEEEVVLVRVSSAKRGSSNWEQLASLRSSRRCDGQKCFPREHFLVQSLALVHWKLLF